MSFSLGLIGKSIAILAIGAGIAVPVAKTLSAPPYIERVKLEKESDLKDSCLIVLQGGEREDREKKHKKLIVCQKNKDPKTTDFFFYDGSKPFDISAFRAVKNIKVDSDNNITLFFEKTSHLQEEIISILGGSWNPFHGLDLKNKTRVNLEEKRMYYSGDQYRLLTTWDQA